MGLNTEQKRCVACKRDLMVLAPPGSGKTGTLVAKTVVILRGQPNARIALVTFTDAAATELRERISKKCDSTQMRRVSVATFHSHAIEQLRAAGKLGRILGPWEATELLRDALREVGSGLVVEDAEAAMHAAKSSPDFTGAEEDFIATYEEKKRAHRALDLQDLTRETVTGMRGGTIKPLPATHVLCDEYQDVDWNQFWWLLEHRAAGATVTVVGDDDQSVYGWRNSLGVTAFREFERLVQPKVVHLEVNYRSCREVLQGAIALIRNNAERIDKNVISNVGDGGRISVVASSSKVAEAEKVADLIESDGTPDAGGYVLVPPGRWGVIARGNRDLWLIAAELRRRRIPFVKSNKRDGEPWEVMAFCGLLVALQTGDSVGLQHGLRAAGISSEVAKALQHRMGEEFFSIMDGQLPDLDFAPIEDVRALKEFSRLCSVWRERVAQGKYREVIAATALWFVENVVRGEDTGDEFMAFAEMLEKGKGPLNVRVSSVFRQEDRKPNGGVSLYTMHSAKGLEFDRVFVAQCNSGTVPASKSASVEEERRLFFVAMTRARSELTLSYVSTKGRSPFLGEVYIAD